MGDLAQSKEAFYSLTQWLIQWWACDPTRSNRKFPEGLVKEVTHFQLHLHIKNLTLNLLAAMFPYEPENEESHKKRVKREGKWIPRTLVELLERLCSQNTALVPDLSILSLLLFKTVALYFLLFVFKWLLTIKRGSSFLTPSSVLDHQVYIYLSVPPFTLMFKKR